MEHDHDHEHEVHGHKHADSHNNGHSHELGRSHSHGRESSKKALLIATFITGIYFITELIGGLFTNSLALLSDAAHMLSDVAALLLSLLAMWFASKPVTIRRTFGFYRAEVLAALANAATLIVISIYIFWEAFQRFKQPQEVQSVPMMVIAIVGLAANLLSAWVLVRGGEHKDNLNIRAALIHVLGDAVGSLGAILAGALMLYTGWYYADPIISVVIGILVLLSSWRLLQETVHVLLEGVPAHVDLKDLRHALLSVAGVESIHDIHVWTVSSGFISMSGHVQVNNQRSTQDVLKDIQFILKHDFELYHNTIQIETESVQDGCSNGEDCIGLGSKQI